MPSTSIHPNEYLQCYCSANFCCIARSESDGTRWRTRGEVKGKDANGVGSQQPSTVCRNPSIQLLSADPQFSAASSRLNWHPRRFKWTRPFRWKTKSGFCACVITFRTCCTTRLPSARTVMFIRKIGRSGHQIRRGAARLLTAPFRIFYGTHVSCHGNSNCHWWGMWLELEIVKGAASDQRGQLHKQRNSSRVQLKCDGTRWRTGGEVKGKLANGVGSQ